MKSEYDDFQSQSIVSSDKNCQDNKSVIMQPVKPQLDMQLPKLAITGLCRDKSCQSPRCYNYKKKSPVRPMYGYDKNCQSANMM